MQSPSVSPLPADDVRAALATSALQGWTYQVVGEVGRIVRDYRFSSFSEAFGFMASVAIRAEALDHHPDWSNAYRRVLVTLTTHDAGGVTERDLVLAREMERLAAGRVVG